jgi:hypothetical protein
MKPPVTGVFMSAQRTARLPHGPPDRPAVDRAMPHPCQNALAQAVIGAHSGDVHRRGDLDSGCYQRRPNKPDKEGAGGLACHESRFLAVRPT